MVEERINPLEEEPEIVPEPKEEEEGEDLSDMFEVPDTGYEKEKIPFLGLTEEDEEELIGVSEEDIMGEEEEAEDDEEKLKEEEKPEEPHWSDEDIRRHEELQRQQLARKPTYKRTAKRYTPPDQIGGTREI